ncbi:hypothetical protein pb186bvf_005687 [Paramecium bursaria]
MSFIFIFILLINVININSQNYLFHQSTVKMHIPIFSKNLDTMKKYYQTWIKHQIINQQIHISLVLQLFNHPSQKNNIINPILSQHHQQNPQSCFQSFSQPLFQFINIQQINNRFYDSDTKNLHNRKPQNDKFNSHLWICIQCVLKSLHLHGLQNQDHIMDQEQFHHFVSQIEKQKMDYYESQFKNIQNLVKISKEMKELIMLVLQFLENELNRIKELNQIQLIQQISKLAKQDFQLISNEQISKVVSIKDTLFECNYESCTKIIKQITLISKKLENIISSIYKKHINRNQNDYQKEKKTQNQFYEYETHFEKKYGLQVSTIEISPDEKSLIVGTNEKEIQIFDLNSQQLMKTFILYDKAMIVNFTADSRYIFCGDQRGYLTIFEIRIFKEIFSKQLHSLSLNGFKIIDNYQIITCSSDKSIIITNIQQNEQVIQIKDAHNDKIYCVDHDQEQDVIISCSVDQSIKLFKRKNGSFLFQSNNAHQFSIQKIQFIQKNKTLISSTIDYKKQQLLILKEISDDTIMSHFTFINNFDQIIVINIQHISIYDQDLKLIQKIDHKVELDIRYQLGSFCNTQQLNSLNFILIIRGDYMKVMKRKLNQVN